MLVGTVMKAFLYSHSAILCPACQSLLAVVGPIMPDPARLRETVECRSHYCTLRGKLFSYERPTVELTDVDPTQT